MKTIAVLVTVFKHNENTLAYLQNLLLQTLAKGFVLDIFLVNDGCTDGMLEEINQKFFSVNSIHADESLFWNQGIRLASKTVTTTGHYDRYLWLNEDTNLKAKSIDHLLECNNEVLKNYSIPSIITGAYKVSLNNPNFSYGARRAEKNSEPNGSLQEYAYINGNIVLVPKAMFNQIGVLSNEYTLGMGDYDYGLRAQQKGFLRFTTKKYIAFCPTNKGNPRWCNPKKPLKDRTHTFNK
jgi:GT2 family glycosyltransferase